MDWFENNSCIENKQNPNKTHFQRKKQKGVSFLK